MATQKSSDKVNKKPNLRDVFQSYSDKREGHFQEATGGGTPIPKGEKLKDHPEVKRVMQPRDDDGQFTYNAVNNIPLKYGPTRGTTIPPLLAGMKINFVNKKKDAVVLDGLVYVAGLDFTKEELMEMLNDYTIDEEKGKITWNKLPDAEMARKKGRRSQAEKDMIKSGDDGYAPNETVIMGGRNKRPDGPRTPNFVNKKPGEKQIGKTPEDGYNPLSPNSTNSTPDDNIGSPSQKSTPEQPQKNSVDVGMAKENPVEFGKKYQNEINEIKKLDPKMTASKIINAFATGKIKSFDQLRKMIELKNSSNKPTKPDDPDTPNRK